MAAVTVGVLSGFGALHGQMPDARTRIVLSSYLGGSANDSANTVAVDASGNVYIAGETSSLNLPVTPGVVQSSNRGNQDAFVAKFDPAGRPLFVTYLGGAGIDIANAIAVDAAGNVYVGGETTSSDFPVTPAAIQPNFRSAIDGFVAKLNSTGTVLTYSTYLGGRDFDRVNGVAVDAEGNAYLTGRTGSDDFPVTPGAFQTSYRGSDFDAYVAKVNPSGGLTWSTYLGGFDNDAAFSVAIDAAREVYVAGGTRSPDFPVTASGYQTSNLSTDGFFVKLNAAGAGLRYSTFLGGSFVDRANGVAVDAAGIVRVTGMTGSSDFPLTAAGRPYAGGPDDAFVAVIDPSRLQMASLLFSTCFGGSGSDRGSGITIAADGSTLVTGQTGSANFPVIAPQQGYGGALDAFVLRLRPATNMVEYASWLGGSGDDRGTGIAAIGEDVWLTGVTGSTNFPVRDAAQPASGGGNDAFVMRIGALAAVPALSPAALLLFAAVLAGIAVCLLEVNRAR